MNLLITLGHNSSAILVSNDGNVLCGYETERLSKIKSDSAFPSLAITEIQKHFNIPANVRIYVSHWFIDGQLPQLPNKWWNPIFISSTFPSAKIISVSKDFTHHDAHCYSALAFCGSQMPLNKTMVLVADGFGNFGETVSIYFLDTHGTPILKHRSFGFSSSLGLFYQYATAYLDMKENQDEYKLLGYEAQISELNLPSHTYARINNHITRMARKLYGQILTSEIDSKHDPLCIIGALPALKESYRVHFNALLQDLDMLHGLKRHIKVIIAFYVQSIIERVLWLLVCKYDPENLVLTGGVFLNVKINNVLSKRMMGKTSIMPLSGDQGAAIGLYHALNDNFKWPGHLFWGKRDFKHIQNYTVEGLEVMSSSLEACKLVADLLSFNMIVNLVTGSMEFGPRALGHTSTLALPTIENVQYINMCNDRSTIMPMAGVVRSMDVDTFHTDVDDIVKSLDYMVCTRDYIDPTEVMGAAHLDPTRNIHTGRTQIVRPNSYLYSILSSIDTSKSPRMLINTSFNPHGKPILFNEEDILFGHNYMLKNDVDNRIVTVVLIED